MTEAEVIDAQAEEEAATEPVGEMVPISESPGLAVTPTVTAGELVERLDVIKQAADRAMQEGVDFGVVPGTNKPTLFKPGAEKLGVLFQLDVQLRNEKTWGPGDHLTVVSHATVFHAPSGARLGYGEGICTTRERKYAYRTAQRECPDCGTKAIIKGQEKYGGGFVCWKKKDGCGAKFDDNDQRIISQDVGEIDNPDLPDLWNTIEKMASKRARVDAVLAVTGASALFTQDMDDEARPAPDETPVDRSEEPRSASNLADEGQRRAVFGHEGTPGLLEKANFDDSQVQAIGRWATVEVQGSDGPVKKLTAKAADFLIEKLSDGSADGRTAVLAEVGWSDTPVDEEGL